MNSFRVVEGRSTASQKPVYQSPATRIPVRSQRTNAREKEHSDRLKMSKRERKRCNYAAEKIRRQLAVPRPQVGRHLRKAAVFALSVHDDPRWATSLREMSVATRLPILDELVQWWRTLELASHDLSGGFACGLSLQLLRTMAGTPHGLTLKKKKKSKERWRNARASAQMSDLFDRGTSIVLRQGSDAAIEKLARYGHGRTWGGRAWAHLLTTDENKYFDAAVTALRRTDHVGFRGHILTAFTRSGPRGEQFLLQVALSGSGFPVELRRQAIAQLPELPGDVCRPALREVVLNDSCKSTRKMALELLIRLGVTEAEVELLVSVAAMRSSRVEAKMAQKALRGVHHEPVRKDAIRKTIEAAGKQATIASAAPFLDLAIVLATDPAHPEPLELLGFDDARDAVTVPLELAVKYKFAARRPFVASIDAVTKARARGGGSTEAHDNKIRAVTTVVLQRIGFLPIRLVNDRHLRDQRFLIALRRSGVPLAV